MKDLMKFLLVIFLILGMIGCSDDHVDSEHNDDNKIVTNELDETIDEISLEEELDQFIVAMLNKSNNSFAYIEDFVPSDKSTSHYRTEFRLSAYDEAIGKSYSYGNTIVDIVARKDFFGEIIIRVYTSGLSIEDCANVTNIVSPIMDKNLSIDDLNTTINLINTEKDLNGYYYGDLGLVLTYTKNDGYEMMIKLESD